MSLAVGNHQLNPAIAEGMREAGQSFVLGYAVNALFSNIDLATGLVGGTLSAVASIVDSVTRPMIAGMFDAIAGHYDLLNHLLSAGIDRRWRRKAIRSLALTGRERVLDLFGQRERLAAITRTLKLVVPVLRQAQDRPGFARAGIQ